MKAKIKIKDKYKNDYIDIILDNIKSIEDALNQLYQQPIIKDTATEFTVVSFNLAVTEYEGMAI